MVTVNEQVLVWPDMSVATQVTVVTPLAKVEPLGGLHATVTPGQLSVAVAVNVTLLFEHRPGSVLPMMLAGQVTCGSSWSRIVTVKLQLLVLPEESVAVQFTVVTPFGKVEPLGGVHTRLVTVALSVAVTRNITLAFEHWPGSVAAMMLAGHVIVGGNVSTTCTVASATLLAVLGSLSTP